MARRSRSYRIVENLDLGPTALKTGRYPVEDLGQLARIGRRLRQLGTYSEGDILRVALQRLLRTTANQGARWLQYQIDELKKGGGAEGQPDTDFFEPGNLIKLDERRKNA